MWPNFEYFRFPEKNRLRFFSFFFALSFLFWVITKLSNNFSSIIKFQVNFINIPDSIILDDDFVEYHTSKHLQTYLNSTLDEEYKLIKESEKLWK